MRLAISGVVRLSCARSVIAGAAIRSAGRPPELLRGFKRLRFACRRGTRRTRPCPPSPPAPRHLALGTRRARGGFAPRRGDQPFALGRAARRRHVLRCSGLQTGWTRQLAPTTHRPPEMKCRPLGPSLACKTSRIFGATLRGCGIANARLWRGIERRQRRSQCRGRRSQDRGRWPPPPRRRRCGRSLVGAAAADAKLVSAAASLGRGSAFSAMLSDETSAAAGPVGPEVAAGSIGGRRLRRRRRRGAAPGADSPGAAGSAASPAWLGAVSSDEPADGESRRSALTRSFCGSSAAGGITAFPRQNLGAHDVNASRHNIGR